MNSIRIVYQSKQFFGGRIQVEATTDYPTLDNIKKCFKQLSKEPLETAIWLEYGEYSKGIWFESEDDYLFGKCKVTYSKRNETDWEFIPYDKVKHDIYNELKSQN